MVKSKTLALGLLEYLSFKAGCMYLSDLRDPQYLPKIQNAVGKMDCLVYSLREWNEAINYITGEKADFLDVKQAAAFLQFYKKEIS